MTEIFSNLGLSIRSAFRNYFNFGGRATVSEFWYFMLFFFLAYAAVWLIDHFFLPPLVTLPDLPFGLFYPAGYMDDQVGLAVLAYRPVMAIPTLSVTVRRLHDVGKSGWWCWLWILPLPVVGWLWLIPWLTRPSAQSAGIDGAVAP